MSHLLILAGVVAASEGGGPGPGSGGWAFESASASGDQTLTNDDRTVTTTGSSAYYWLETDSKQLASASDLFYWEIDFTFADLGAELTVNIIPQGVIDGGDSRSLWTDDDGGFVWRGDGFLMANNSTVVSSSVDALGNGDIAMIAFNPLTLSIWLGVNGTWRDDPDTDDPTWTLTDWETVEEFRIGVGVPGTGDAATLISLDDDFNYTKPTGAVALGDSPSYDTRARGQNLAAVYSPRPAAVTGVRSQSLYVIYED